MRTSNMAIAASFSALCLPLTAGAQTTESKTADQSTQTPVIVQGQKSVVGERIDRRIYDVKNDPDAKTGTLIDILGKIPSVQVTPAGKPTLRGDPNVTVLVDGKAPASGNAAIRTIPSSDVDRIEVMTNPSSQYAPDGTAGIINIITKKRHPLGISGNVSARASSQGETSVVSTVHGSRGAWSVDGQLNEFHVPFFSRGYSLYTKPFTARTDDMVHGTSENFLAGLSANYKISDNASFTLNTQEYLTQSKSLGTTHYDSAAAAYDNREQQAYRFGQNDVEATYEYNNEASGDHVTIDGDHTNTDNFSIDQNTVAQGAGTAFIGVRQKDEGNEDNVKLDYEKHFSTGSQLTAGAQWDRHEVDDGKIFDQSGSVPITDISGYSRGFKASQTIGSAYVTYQFTTGKWSFLPGVRYEDFDLRIVSAKGSKVQKTGEFYPSLHISRDVGKNSKLKLSYSRRIQRPDLTQYDPGIMTLSPSIITVGNPSLRPTNTDSFEVEYAYNHGKKSYEIAGYVRSNSALQSVYGYVTSEGSLVTQPVNIGRSRSTGIELTLKGPITDKTKYTVNANLYSNYIQQFDNPQTYGSYSGNFQIEHDTPSRVRGQNEEYQLNLTVTGRQYTYQGDTGGYWRIDATWQHPITDKAALVISAIDIARSQRNIQRYATSSLQLTRKSVPSDQALRVGLSYKLGK